MYSRFFLALALAVSLTQTLRYMWKRNRTCFQGGLSTWRCQRRHPMRYQRVRGRFTYNKALNNVLLLSGEQLKPRGFDVLAFRVGHRFIVAVLGAVLRMVYGREPTCIAPELRCQESSSPVSPRTERRCCMKTRLAPHHARNAPHA